MEYRNILVIGLGNPILGDDGVGWRVGEAVQEILNKESMGKASDSQKYKIDIECLAEGGLRLMEIMVGYDYAVIIDAITTHNQPIGSVSCFPIEKMPDLTAGHFASPHNTTLQTALQLGRELNLSLPEKVIIIGIEAKKVYDLSEELTPSIKDSIPQAVHQTIDLLKNLISGSNSQEGKNDIT
ncbi:MAG: hydrogenase maturation protease [Chloroflexota bacterium]|jgi:hydrogenase maturation protease